MKDLSEQGNAGPFSAWLAQTLAFLQGGEPVDVPCGSCTACCTSGFYIAVSRQETATLKMIPDEFLFEIPGSGDAVYIGCDDRGHCLLLNEGRCSIYQDRPIACRTFDCRIYTATGIRPEKDNISPISCRIGSWMFEYPTKKDQVQQWILQAAALILASRLEIEENPSLGENSRVRALGAILLAEKIEQEVNL